MKISKKRLRERLKDIAAGAGMPWLEYEQYWENLTMENMGRFMNGIQEAFAVDKDSFLLHYNNFYRYEDLDKAVDFIYRYKETQLK